MDQGGWYDRSPVFAKDDEFECSCRARHHDFQEEGLASRGIAGCPRRVQSRMKE